MRVSTLLCVVTLASFNSGCVFNVGSLVKDISDTIADAIRDSSPPPDSYHGIDFKDTELFGLFARYEAFDSRKPADQHFPRVALTVITAPPNHFRKTMDRTKSCWRLRAKIWLSLEEYRFVEPFDWCTHLHLVPPTVPLDDANAWFSAGVNGAHTGNIRTEGPIPPAAAIPTDLKHQEFWGASGFGPASMNGQMLVGLLYHMGLDWTNRGDRRVWIVEFSQALW